MLWEAALQTHSTRTNQTKPRTGEAIREDESYPRAMNPVCERSNSPSFVTRQRQVNQENPRGGRRRPFCKNLWSLTSVAQMVFRITNRTYVTWP